MRLGRIIAKTVALPVRAVVEVPTVAANIVDEVGKAVTGEK